MIARGADPSPRYPALVLEMWAGSLAAEGETMMEETSCGTWDSSCHPAGPVPAAWGHLWRHPSSHALSHGTSRRKSRAGPEGSCSLAPEQQLHPPVWTATEAGRGQSQRQPKHGLSNRVSA